MECAECNEKARSASLTGGFKMEIQECITGRRSIRSFEDKKVPHEILEKIVGLAAYAPSWKNTQITRYVAIEGREKIDEIAERYASFNARNLSTCPLLIAVTVLKKRSGYEKDGSFSTDRGDGWQMFDCGIAVQTFCLAAHEQGIGTVIMGIFDRSGLEKYLNIPEDRELAALIAAGYPNQEPSAPKRKKVKELLSYC